jgi:general stress protein YciG
MAALKQPQPTKLSTVLIFMQESVQSGGKVGRTGGFYANRDLARKAGAKGGRISRRGKSNQDSAAAGASTVASEIKVFKIFKKKPSYYWAVFSFVIFL